MALAVTACGLAYDPGAYAADPKRTLLVLLGAAATVTSLTAAARSTRHRARGASPRAPRAVPRALAAALTFVALSVLSLLWGRAPGALDAATWIAAASVGAFSFRMRAASAMACARLAGLWLGGAVGRWALASALLGARGFALHAGQGNPNWLGLLLAVTLPLALDTCILHARRGRRFARRGALVLLFTAPQVPALYLSHSRVAWVAAGVACLFVLAFALLARRRRTALGALAATLLLACALLSGSPASAEERDALTADVPAAQSLHGRVLIWKASAVAARSALPFGSGLGSFAHAFHDAQGLLLEKLTPSAAARAYENATTAHQEYLQTATESGPLATLALVLALVLGAAGSVRARFLGGAGSLAACGITALGDSPLRQPAVVLLVALTLGALRGASTTARAARTLRTPLAGRGFLVVLLVASACGLTRAARSWLGTRAYMASFDAAPDARMRLLGRSARLDPEAGEPRFERALLLLSMGEPRDALVDLDAASARMADTGIFSARGQAHLALEEPRAAEADYRQALTWNPGSLRARVGLAESCHRQGKHEEAEAQARIAKKLSPGNPQVRELLDAIHESQADE